MSKCKAVDTCLKGAEFESWPRQWLLSLRFLVFLLSPFNANFRIVLRLDNEVEIRLGCFENQIAVHCYSQYHSFKGHMVEQLLETLFYEPEGREFDS
jgi:hypothetical protein